MGEMRERYHKEIAEAIDRVKNELKKEGIELGDTKIQLGNRY